MSDRIPFLLVGDQLGQPTGLSRILGDLAVRLWQERDALGIDVRVAGYVPWESLPHHGVAGQSELGIPLWSFSDLTRWGADAVSAAYRSWFGARKGILLSIWDAHRCYPFTQLDLPVTRWGYVPVDGETHTGTIGGGMARSMLMAYDRLLAYGPYGAQVIQHTLRAAAQSTPIAHLPHGLDAVWQKSTPDHWLTQALTARGPAVVWIGTVATNQPRKDWGLVAATLHALRKRGVNAHGWWHVDQPVTAAWSIPQLVEDYDLAESVYVTTHLDEQGLAAGYRACAVTIAPGRGEGFGYPIIESLACGTPVVHVQYAGGADLTPESGQVAPAWYHPEGPYAILRPILNPLDVADRVQMYLREAPVRALAEWAGYPTVYQWQTIWPLWHGWFADGLALWRDRA